jgi:hypothetical protein
MFEKEAEKRCSEYFQENCYKENRWADTHDLVAMYLEGYNKANEWHYHLMPKDYTKPYLCKVIHPTKNDMTDYEILFYDENEMSWFRWLMPWDGGDLNTAVRINRKVIAWKEIISPMEDMKK